MSQLDGEESANEPYPVRTYTNRLIRTNKRKTVVLNGQRLLDPSRLIKRNGVELEPKRSNEDARVCDRDKRY